MSATNSLTASSSSGAVAGYTAAVSTSAGSAQSGINVDEELAAQMVNYDDEPDVVTESPSQPPTFTEQLGEILKDTSDPIALNKETKDRRLQRRLKIPDEEDLASPGQEDSTGNGGGPAAEPDLSPIRSGSRSSRSRRPPTPPDSRTNSM